MTAVLLGSADQRVTMHWRSCLEAAYSIHCDDNLEKIFDQCKSGGFSLIILDYALLVDDFAESISRVQHDAPESKILLIGSKCSRKTQLKAFGQGIPGYMESDVTAELMVKGVDRLLNGEVWLGRQMVSALLEKLRKENPPARENSRPENLSSLTPREMDIARRICQGENNKKIANHLDITERTVKAHLGSIFRKLEVADRLQLALQLKDYFSE